MINPHLAKYIGTPYELVGRTSQGVDCWGAIWLIYKQDLNIQLPAFLGCYHDIGGAEAHALVAHERASPDWTKLGPNPSHLQDYDILLYHRRRLHAPPCPHVALYAGSGRILHCLEGAGICLGHVDDLSTYRLTHNSFGGAFRHKRMSLPSQNRAV